MKKSFLVLAILATAFKFVKAQDLQHNNVVSGSMGLSLFNAGSALVKPTLTNLGQDDSQLVNTSSGPTYQIAVDHSFSQVFSLGGAISYSHFNANATNFNWKDAAGNISNGFFDINLTRTTVGMRALFHYGNKGRIDMYSGVRLGIGIWKVGFKSDLTALTPGELNKILTRSVSPQFQVIPFALRGYITENIGLGFETAIGSPYLASLSLQYRFGSNAAK